MKRIVIVLFLLLGIGMNAQLFDGWVSNSKTTTEINALVSPLTGRFEYNSTTGTIWVFNGTIWVDLGTAGGGSGDVIKVGAPVDNQIGIWTGDGTIEGTTALTYDGTQMQMTGNLVATGSLNATNHVSAGGSFVSVPSGLTTISGQAAFGYTDDDEFSFARRAGIAYPNGDANTRAVFNTGELSVNRTFILPDKPGTFAMLDDVTASNFGIVAQGSAVVGSTATVTVTHGLGFAPAIDRITLTASAATGAYNISVGNVTTTQMDIINTNAGSSTVFWKIFGSGNVTPVTEGHVIEDNAVAQTQRANLNFVGATITDDVANDRTTVTITGGGIPDDDSVTPVKMADGDFGAFSIAANVASIDANTVGSSEVDLTDNYTWTGSHTWTSQPIFDNVAPTISFPSGGTRGLLWTRDGITGVFQLDLNDTTGDFRLFHTDGSGSTFTLPRTGAPTISGYTLAEQQAGGNDAIVLKDYVDTKIASDITGYGAGVTATDNIVVWDYDVNSTEPTAGVGDTVLGVNIPNAKTVTGTTVLDLGDYKQIDDTLVDTATWTLTNIKEGGHYEVLVNLATEPTITGATKIPNTAAFIANTDMLMSVKVFGSTVKYFFTEW